MDILRRVRRFAPRLLKISWFEPHSERLISLQTVSLFEIASGLSGLAMTLIYTHQIQRFPLSYAPTPPEPLISRRRYRRENVKDRLENCGRFFCIRQRVKRLRDIKRLEAIHTSLRYFFVDLQHGVPSTIYLFISESANI